MPTYHQMGHDSRNLLWEDANLRRSYSGAVLSPVNYDEGATSELIGSMEEMRADFDFILDPQLYYPRSKRGRLRTWSYFPDDVDTADVFSLTWWRRLNRNLASTANRLGVGGVCSPAIVPRTFGGDVYHALMADVASDLVRVVDDSSVDVYQTSIVGIDDLAEPKRALKIASLITKSDAKRVFLVFYADVEPRREIYDTDSLKGAMKLIYLLEQAGFSVLVGFTSSDVALWKFAGATSCATGKFFNLRRFTKSRFEELTGGGGQLPYWFEEAVFAYCRESDVLRLRKAGLLSGTSTRNPMSAQVLDSIDQGIAWLGLSWRHYLNWFADFEQRATGNPDIVKSILKDAEVMWDKLEDRNILMEERRNDGKWLRPWRRAIAEFKGF